MAVETFGPGGANNGRSAVEPLPGPSDVTEGQAREGGCCLCPPGCGGLDIDDAARARGVVECAPHCAWCMNGCPSPIEMGCFCMGLTP